MPRRVLIVGPPTNRRRLRSGEPVAVVAAGDRYLPSDPVPLETSGPHRRRSH